MARPIDEEPRLTLTELAARLPKPPALARESYVGAGHDDDFITVGTQIATERVLTDCRRLYAEAYFAHEALSEEQREELVGFSPELLSYAVREALGLAEKNDAYDRAAGASREMRAKTDAGVAAAHKRAVLRRTQAHSTLARAAAGDPVRLAAVAVALGTADTESNLANSVSALAKLVTEWLDAPKDSPLRVRLSMAKATPAYAKALERDAEALREANAADEARGHGSPVTQRELDHDDGLNLFLLGQIVDAFDAAHDLDASIPRLVPQATRRLLRPTRERRQKASPDAPAPAPAK